MENRSFDHLLGWVPNAEGAQQGRTFTDVFGTARTSFALTADPAYGFQGCAFADPNHSYDAGRIHLANGALNGFLRTVGTSLTPGDLLPIGYFQAADLEFYRGAVAQYTVCDYYMSGILADTYPNRIYLHSGETDRLSDTLDSSSLPTIWDRLDAKNVSSTYYFHDVPFTALYGTRYVGRSKPFAQFLTDAASGSLRRSAWSIRVSAEKRKAFPTTTILMPTCAMVRCCSVRSTMRCAPVRTGARR
jgi:phospholipase C